MLLDIATNQHSIPRAAQAALSMLVMVALRVISQDLNHPAFANSAMLAFVDHSREFLTQGAELCQPPVDRLKVSASDGIRLMARLIGPCSQVKEFADILHAKAEFSRMADEVEPVDLILLVASLLPLGPHGLWEQTNLLIIPDGRNLHLSAARQFTNC